MKLIYQKFDNITKTFINNTNFINLIFYYYFVILQIYNDKLGIFNILGLHHILNITQIF